MSKKHFLFRNFWVITFFLVCSICFEQKVFYLNQEIDKLNSQLSSLTKKRDEALQKQKQLKLQIQSQSDYAWIELTLIKELGVKPKGQTKVIFE